ncbi:hypothetical protein B6U55_03285 [Ligilactobacillus salivarius]|uniref:hypothetical protein n=1 Tax=Ligilactobacillus salivarius TaxID=1624 RepID=UPI0009D914DD|nr:hypothetical protein [Ligilactobacillus salivarius]OQQ93770.1 hypothetical protein B6U55_03285 [Ligilactobacillus salivarius]
MNWLGLLAEALRKLTTKELPGLQKQMYAYIDNKHRETIKYIDDKIDTRNPIVTKEELDKINDRLDEIERKLGGSDEDVGR